MSRDSYGESGAGGVGCDAMRLSARTGGARCASRFADGITPNAAVTGPSESGGGLESATASQVLGQYALGAGLVANLVAFPSAGSLGQRLRENPLLMAPMAGVSDAAYRMMARAGGAALAYSEMVSVAGLHYANQKTWDLVLPQDPEPDIAVQVFGSDPEQFAEAAEAICERLGSRLVLLDINMACPVPKVTKGGGGSALLDEPELAASIVRACCSHANVPVTVKIRRGRRMGEEVAPEFAKTVEQAGAAAIAVHGRFAKQLYHGEADWDAVSRVVDAVTIPVIGSGDVMSHEDALRMMEQTGCTAVMIARGTYGNPWVFSLAKPTTQQRLAAFACHVRLLDATGAHMARARSLAGWYLRGMPHAAAWRNRAMSCTSVVDYLAMANEIGQWG